MAKTFLGALLMWSFLPALAFLAGQNYESNHAWAAVPALAVVFVAYLTAQSQSD